MLDHSSVATLAEIQAELAELRYRARKTVGISAHAFDNQSISYDNDALARRIHELERLVDSMSGTPRVRYIATDKGC